jgi:hypothetical protein
MSSDIEIIEEEDCGVDVIVRANAVQLQVHEYYSKYTEFIFDMTNQTHRQALKNLVDVLQHELDIHGVNNE